MNGPYRFGRRCIMDTRRGRQIVARDVRKCSSRINVLTVVTSECRLCSQPDVAFYSEFTVSLNCSGTDSLHLRTCLSDLMTSQMR